MSDEKVEAGKERGKYWWIRYVVVPLIAIVVAVIANINPSVSSTPPNTSTATDTPIVTFTLTFTPSPGVLVTVTPTCPSADAEGTVPPAVAIYSITFVVNDVEQVVNDANSLQAFSSGDQVRVKEVTICPVEPFEGSGGKVYVEFDPVNQDNQEIGSEIKGTQAVSVPAGFSIISYQGQITHGASTIIGSTSLL